MPRPGATVAKTPAELAGAVDAIITILTDAAAIDTVYHGPQGLLSGDVKGKLFIEMSTVPPETAPALAVKVRAAGAAFVECPVGGSTGPARAGKLLGMMGAEPADAARARPILDHLCRRVQRAGPVGSAATLKLAVNLPLMIYWQALGEQLSICKPLDIDPAELLDFLSETSGAATVLKQRMPGIAAKLKSEPSEHRDLQPRRRHQGRQSHAGGGKAPRHRAAARRQDARMLRGGQAPRHRRRRGLQRLGLLGQPRQALTLPPFRKQSEFTCQESRSRKPPPSSTSRSRRRANRNFQPMTVAVLDAGGHLVAFKREDKSGILRYDIAYGKAWGALGMGFGSRTLAERAAATPQFFTMLAAASGGRIITNPAGILIRDASGDVIGAVGLSGDTGDNDEICGVAGIEAAGLKADPGGSKK